MFIFFQRKWVRSIERRSIFLSRIALSLTCRWVCRKSSFACIRCSFDGIDRWTMQISWDQQSRTFQAQLLQVGEMFFLVSEFAEVLSLGINGTVITSPLHLHQISFPSDRFVSFFEEINFIRLHSMCPLVLIAINLSTLTKRKRCAYLCISLNLCVYVCSTHRSCVIDASFLPSLSLALSSSFLRCLNRMRILVSTTAAMTNVGWFAGFSSVYAFSFSSSSSIRQPVKLFSFLYQHLASFSFFFARFFSLSTRKRKWEAFERSEIWSDTTFSLCTLLLQTMHWLRLDQSAWSIFSIWSRSFQQFFSLRCDRMMMPSTKLITNIPLLC